MSIIKQFVIALLLLNTSIFARMTKCTSAGNCAYAIYYLNSFKLLLLNFDILINGMRFYLSIHISS